MKAEYDPFEGVEDFSLYEAQEVTNHHKTLVERLSKPGQDIITTLTPEKTHLLHMVVGVAGEAGELLDAIKKHVIYGKELDLQNIVEEVGDILFYLQGIAGPLNISLDLCKIHNIIKLEKRYGETYSDKAAQERVDKDGD